MALGAWGGGQRTESGLRPRETCFAFHGAGILDLVKVKGRTPQWNMLALWNLLQGVRRAEFNRVNIS